jgi:hypothetical protein
MKSSLEHGSLRNTVEECLLLVSVSSVISSSTMSALNQNLSLQLMSNFGAIDDWLCCCPMGGSDVGLEEGSLLKLDQIGGGKSNGNNIIALGAVKTPDNAVGNT